MVKWRDVELPGFSRPLAPVSEERRAALRDHLQSAVPQDAPFDRYSSTRWTPQPAGHYPDACAACGGFCCRLGGDIAFLTDGALHLIWRDNPRLTRDELIDGYLARIPDEAFEGSCIFHTAQGCNLPGNLRSVVCNTYLCEPLKEIASRP